MFGRLVTLLATVIATTFVAGPVAAADSSYGTKVSTTCSIQVRTAPGKPIAMRVAVRANASDPITGTLSLNITQAGQSVWRKSAVYKDKPVTVTGPKLPTGDYKATASFKSSSGTYADCNGAVSFHARGVAPESTGTHPGGGTGPGSGGLPNTGGPSVLWLLLGFALLLAGGGTVVASRREKVHVWS